MIRVSNAIKEAKNRYAKLSKGHAKGRKEWR